MVLRIRLRDLKNENSFVQIVVMEHRVRGIPGCDLRTKFIPRRVFRTVGRTKFGIKPRFSTAFGVDFLQNYFFYQQGFVQFSDFWLFFFHGFAPCCYGCIFGFRNLGLVFSLVINLQFRQRSPLSCDSVWIGVWSDSDFLDFW